MPTLANQRTAPPARPPYLSILPGATPLRRYAKDLWHHKDLVRVLAMRDVKLRYRQTVLGVLWVVLQPVVGAAAVAFVFGRIARLGSEGVSYFAFAFAGVLAWNAFSNTFLKATNSLVGNTGLVSKIFFPRLLLPLSTVVSALIDFAVALCVMVVLFFGDDIALGPAIALIPLWVGLILMCGLGFGFALAAISVSYRDVMQVSSLGIQVVFYVTPVAYSVAEVPERLRALYYLNPLVPLFEGFRWSCLGTSGPTAGHLAYGVAVTVVLFVAGAVFLQRSEPKFADVI